MEDVLSETQGERSMRVAVLLEDRCQPKKCNAECWAFCPPVRNGIECIVFDDDTGKPIVSEPLCIGCGICYAACDLVSWNPDYLGPAALNRAWTLVNDVRDADPNGHLKAVAGDAGWSVIGEDMGLRVICPASGSEWSAHFSQ